MNRNESELQFWKEHLKGANTDTNNKQVYEAFAHFINKRFTDTMSVLDLGSGAYNTLGNYAGDIKLKVYCTDYLANEYKKLNAKCEVLFADMGNLSYGDKQFDIVHCSNALDHCEQPHKAIQEMKRVGKRVFLRHFTNVGKIERYEGMHEFDIFERNGYMVIADKEGNEVEYKEFVAWKDDKFTYSYYE